MRYGKEPWLHAKTWGFCLMAEIFDRTKTHKKKQTKKKPHTCSAHAIMRSQTMKKCPVVIPDFGCSHFHRIQSSFVQLQTLSVSGCCPILLQPPYSFVSPSVCLLLCAMVHSLFPTPLPTRPLYFKGLSNINQSSRNKKSNKRRKPLAIQICCRQSEGGPKLPFPCADFCLVKPMP